MSEPRTVVEQLDAAESGDRFAAALLGAFSARDHRVTTDSLTSTDDSASGYTIRRSEGER